MFFLWSGSTTIIPNRNRNHWIARDRHLFCIIKVHSLVGMVWCPVTYIPGIFSAISIASYYSFLIASLLRDLPNKKGPFKGRRGYRQNPEMFMMAGANMCPYRHFIQIFEKMCGCLAKTWVTWVHIPLSWDTFCLTSFFHGKEFSFWGLIYSF
jgi:hypothetical protein